MRRKVFFSFHYQGDIGRIGQIRNSWLTKGAVSKFLDAADWESIKKNGDRATEAWISEQLNGTSVTVVLIGLGTANRRWVKYEIKKSIEKRNGLLGIYIHEVKEFRTSLCSNRGEDPFKKHFNFQPTEAPTYPCCNYYDWVTHDGYNNIEKWIEKAARQAGR